ncbi:hypothetical protein CBFG_03918 [Clostridiales bacterium 1_7_47FAA]|nr:hypothetical protein CBFG_03918 [Clostridiales bacterium 1_7_47FAA]
MEDTAGCADRTGTKYATEWDRLCPKGRRKKRPIGRPVTDSLRRIAETDFQIRSNIMICRYDMDIAFFIPWRVHLHFRLVITHCHSSLSLATVIHLSFILLF